ncbi:MAG: type II toxin-antitoxin system RelE/ParE family toxin [Coxiellaceae bacterium]|nr:type II toxin-antitoxin system RelE/ParE family toxin [Coxiellaceae bacterium]
MSYELYFHPTALKEWKKLPALIRDQFKKTLNRRMHQPDVKSAKLSGKLADCYKIKLRNSGFRLVYQVKRKQLHIIVIAVGKRDKEMVYKYAKLRGAKKQ